MSLYKFLPLLHSQVNSLGRPLADRSVIYKYLNPNAMAVVSESIDQSTDRAAIMLHIIDAVSGKVSQITLKKELFLLNCCLLNPNYTSVALCRSVLYSQLQPIRTPVHPEFRSIRTNIFVSLVATPA